jgi:signal transduction histidine kinase
LPYLRSTTKGSQNREIDEAVIAASEREQRLLGEELHETICQSLCAISIHLQTLRRRVHAGKNVAPMEIDELHASVDRVIEQTRALSRQLNLKQPETNGLVQALQALAHAANKVAACRFEGDAAMTVHPRDARTLYRIAQEAIRNALQHAGAAQITIRLVATSRCLTMEVHDNGPGFVMDQAIPKTGGLGMMRRQMESTGGSLKVLTKPGTGTIIRCTLPQKQSRAQPAPKSPRRS